MSSSGSRDRSKQAMSDDRNWHIARAIIDSSRYLTLGTADESGLPWVSPVWYAPDGYREFFWVSAPGRGTRETWRCVHR